MRRDALIEIATKVNVANSALIRLKAIHEIEKSAVVKGSDASVSKQAECGLAWNEAYSELPRLVVIAGLACGSEVTTTLNDFSIYVNNLANEVTHGQPEAFLTKIQEYTAKRDAITKAMRKEIGNDSEPMFLST